MGKVVRIGSINDTSMKWRGVWLDGEYVTYDVVRDGEWTMIANKHTSDRPAPQEIGEDEDSVNVDSLFTDSNDTSIVKMVHNFTMTKSGWLKSLDVRVPFFDGDSVSKITLINLTSGVARVINNPILTSDNWVTLAVDNSPIAAGTQLQIWFEFYNASAANAINGGWTSNAGTGIPTSQEFNIDNLSTPTVIEISHTDLDSGNRTTELDGVVSGSIIRLTETGDVNRNIEFKVDTVDLTSGTSTKYTVLAGSINNGQKDIRDNKTVTVHIDVPITQPSRYDKLTAYYPTNNPSWATITTELYFNNVLQAGSVDAYGINLNFQEASISNDWDLVATSEGSGGSQQTGVFHESTSLSIGDSGQAFVTDSAGTLLANDATTVIDSTKGGVQVGHGNYDVASFYFDISNITEPCQILFKCVVTPNNNANFGMEYRTFTDKTDIPGSLVDSQTSAYKISRSGMNNEVTTSFLYNPDAQKIEALQIYGVSQNNETITLKVFNIWLNKLWQ